MDQPAGQFSRTIRRRRASYPFQAVTDVLHLHVAPEDWQRAAMASPLAGPDAPEAAHCAECARRAGAGPRNEAVRLAELCALCAPARVPIVSARCGRSCGRPAVIPGLFARATGALDVAAGH